MITDQSPFGEGGDLSDEPAGKDPFKEKRPVSYRKYKINI
jgi:hypothetical protein